MILAAREFIAEQLWLRDEPDLARAMLDADDATHRRILELAAEPGTGSWLHSRVDELLVTAAIEVLSGERRRPRRWRARPEEHLDRFWQEVGPERDRRDDDDPLDDVLRRLDED